jgi:hypothetical protein
LFCEAATDALGPDDVALGFVEAEGLFDRRSRLLRAVREAQNLAEIGKRLRSQVENVRGCGRYRHCLPPEAFGLVELASPRQDLRPHSPPLGLPIGIFGQREAVGAPSLGQLQRFPFS